MAEVALTTTVQSQQSLKIQTPLGLDVMDIREFKGTETISKPFEFSAFVISTNRAIDFNAILGQSVTASFDTGTGIRYFNGIAGEIWQRETARINDDNVTVYELKIYPRFWLLKFASDCRIFQNLPTIQIITSVLEENGVVNIKNLVTTAGQTPREYCVQYNETCYDFVCRLMEEEGIYYYFTHQDGLHTIVLGDSPTGHQACPINSNGQFLKASGSDYPSEIIYECQALQRVTVSAHAFADYNFTTAITPLYARIQGMGVGKTLYNYPAHHDHEDKPMQANIEAEAKLALDRDEASKESLEGKSTHPFFTAGHQFNLLGYDRTASNGSYVIKSVTHYCTSNTYGSQKGQNIYTNEFEAFPLRTVFRPSQATPKPRIYSTQTARVTGKAGEEIWTDQYGRIKVKFHWDELSPHAGFSDERSSCWVRVAEGWAGAGWGILFTPRIGMEVLVTFLDGNPDRPLVTGCVWNSSNMPPYLPTTPTKSTIKSRSTKGATTNEFNEFRYEDLRGSEQVYLRAQKDLDQYVIQNSTKHVEQGSEWKWIDRGDLDVAVLAGMSAVPKTTPAGQSLPMGKGDYNLEITGGCWNIDQLSIKGKVSHNHYMVFGDYNYQIDQGDVFKLQKSGSFFQQMNLGNYERFIEQGHESLAINTGDKRTFIQQGEESLRIGCGSQSTLLDQGSQYTNLNMGDRIKVVDVGNDCELIRQGSKYSTINQGNSTFKINQGNQEIILMQGNREKGLMAGNETNYINGELSETVTGSSNLIVMQDLMIEVTGNITLMSQGSISLTAGQNISLEAMGDIITTAGGSQTSIAATGITQAAGTSVSIDAGMDVTVAAGMNITCDALASVTIASALDTNIAGGVSVAVESAVATTIEGLANVNITGATIMMTA